MGEGAWSGMVERGEEGGEQWSGKVLTVHPVTLFGDDADDKIRRESIRGTAHIRCFGDKAKRGTRRVLRNC